jgi:hypothetical protein
MEVIMRVASCGLLAIAILTTVPLFAQSSLPASQGQSVHAKVNELADLSRAGNADATTELTRQMFRTNGIPSDITDSYGFTDRIVQAEAAYRDGSQAPVHEADIVKAINNLANAFGAPAWVHTNQVEVHNARMRLIVPYPRLFASQEPPDANGNYKAPSENMRPVEAAYIAITLLYQKHYNTLFQFTEEEQAENAKLDAATVKAKHLQRIQDFESLFRGASSRASGHDLLNAADYFFDDLGIEHPATSSRIAIQKSTP